METLLMERVNELISGCKTQKALSGGLLPLNNNASVLAVEEITTVTVVDTDGETPVAFGAFNRYSANQAYCMLNEIVDKYRKNYVKVEKFEKEGDAKQNVMLKITDVTDERHNLGGLSPYYAAFAERTARPLLQHVVDELLACTVGTGNMDVKKNITVDLYDEQTPEYNTFDDALWRDFSGFVVTDRFRYFEVDIPKKALTDIAATQNNSEPQLSFDTLNKKSEPFFVDYDSSVAIVHRQEFLEFFMGLHGMKGTIAYADGSEPVGYVLSQNDRVLQCYAETPEISTKLLAKHAESMNCENVKMFVRYDNDWITEQILQSATTARRVRRFHTRTMPAQVKWSKVFVVNTGLHLF